MGVYTMARNRVEKSRFIQRRSLLLLILCAVGLLAVFIRLFSLQVTSYDRYNTKVTNKTRRTVSTTPERGSIYDAKGTKLASNYTVYRVFIAPKDLYEAEKAYAEAKDKETATYVNRGALISGLAEILGMDEGEIRNIIETYSDKRDRTLKKNVNEETAEEVRQLIKSLGLEELKLVNLEASSKRYYPYGSLASHVLGFTGTDGGLLGVELQYDDYLTGSAGTYISAKDAHGSTLNTKYETNIELQDGYDVYLTIDATLQNILETQLRTTYKESDPLNRVVGVAVDVNTGAVLACATFPNFDCNDPYNLDSRSQLALDALGYPLGSEEYNNAFYSACYAMWRNKAISDLYEPGSTFKIITYSMAVEEDVFDWKEEMTCEGLLYIDGIKIHCHRQFGHGLQTYARALQQSCNPGCMQVAQRVGRQKWYEYFQAFGYTEKTGIDLPGESNSIYAEYSSFTNLTHMTSSFGQSFKISPIQQITGVSAVANGGYLMQPHVVSKIVDSNGNIVYQQDSTVKRQVVSSNTCKQMMAVLEEGVSTDGGAKNAYVAGYKIAAKTGTSEVLDILDEEGNAYLRVGSTIGIAPADDPQIAVLIVVDQPQCENVFGSYVAAPYVANFMSEALPYLGVERNLTPEEEANLAVTLRNYVGLTVTEVSADLTNRGIKYSVFGDGEKVTYQIPAGGATLDKASGKVLIYSGDIKPSATVSVPDVLGRTAKQAQNEIVGAGLNIALEGATNLEAGEGAVAVSQTPAAGEQVEYGTVVTVVMRHIGITDD